MKGQQISMAGMHYELAAGNGGAERPWERADLGCNELWAASF